jgi:hypothetical protein
MLIPKQIVVSLSMYRNRCQSFYALHSTTVILWQCVHQLPNPSAQYNSNSVAVCASVAQSVFTVHNTTVILSQCVLQLPNPSAPCTVQQ